MIILPWNLAQVAVLYVTVLLGKPDFKQFLHPLEEARGRHGLHHRGRGGVGGAGRVHPDAAPVPVVVLAAVSAAVYPLGVPAACGLGGT